MKLTVSAAQMDVIVSEPQENLKKAEARVAEAVEKGSDLICFPEMWTTGFNWANNKRMARDHEKVIDQVADMARHHKIWINGSMLALTEKGNVANTSILFDSKGNRAAVYRKTHLYTFLHEEKHMEAGNSLSLVDTPWGLTGLTVCYDIRFPELFRTYALKGAKVILSPMAFPHPKLEHWKVLVRARAIENQLFMIGANHVGNEDFGEDGMVSYLGDSVIIGPWGETIVEASGENEELLTATVDISESDEIRNKMKVLEDRRPDLYELS
ncbi:nitrilase-related carbon-nitrogen hydrolase [Candidatus Auribacterota bacterium]